MFLSWIPIIGPIIEGITRIFTGLTDAKIAKIKSDADVDKAILRNVEVYRDDPGVRLSRDIILFPVAVWTALTTWDSIVVHHWPNLVWSTGPFIQGSGLEYLPYAVLTFLFGINLMRFTRRG